MWALRPLGQVLQEREQRLVRPVQIVEHEHARTGGGQSFQEAPPGREQLLPLRRRSRLDPDQRRQPLQQPLPLGLLGRDSGLQLPRRDLCRVRLEDARLRLDDLAQRPEGDPLPVGQAAPLPPADDAGLRVEVGSELGDQPALAHPRLADDRDQLHRALLRRPLKRPDQKRLLQLATDERRFELAADVATEAGASRPRPPKRQRLRLPLHRHRLKRLVLEHAARRPVGLLPDRHPVHRRRTLDSSGRIDDVTGDHPFALLRAGGQRHHRLARVDPHPHLQVEIGIGLVQLLDRLQNPQPSPHRPLGVVLMRHRSPAHGHHRITDELFHRAAVALDLLPQPGMVGPDARAHVLRVLLFRSSGEPDQVAEEDGDHLPLLQYGRRRRLDQRRCAVAAEGEPLRILLPAASTCRHGSSLGRPTL